MMENHEVILRIYNGMADFAGYLIRCKDCKFYEKVVEDIITNTPRVHYCRQMDREGFYESDFCSLAERREDETEN